MTIDALSAEEFEIDAWNLMSNHGIIKRSLITFWTRLFGTIFSDFQNIWTDKKCIKIVFLRGKYNRQLK